MKNSNEMEYLYKMNTNVILTKERIFFSEENEGVLYF